MKKLIYVTLITYLLQPQGLHLLSNDEPQDPAVIIPSHDGVAPSPSLLTLPKKRASWYQRLSLKKLILAAIATAGLVKGISFAREKYEEKGARGEVKEPQRLLAEQQSSQAPIERPKIQEQKQIPQLTPFTSMSFK